MFEFMQDADNYEDRKIGRDTSKSGIGISTAYTSDEGYETALIDSDGVHPVERYDNKEMAEIGHAKWLEFADDGNGKEIVKLGGSGIGGLAPDETITLKP